MTLTLGDAAASLLFHVAEPAVRARLHRVLRLLDRVRRELRLPDDLPTILSPESRVAVAQRLVTRYGFDPDDADDCLSRLDEHAEVAASESMDSSVTSSSTDSGEDASIKSASRLDRRLPVSSTSEDSSSEDSSNEDGNQTYDPDDDDEAHADGYADGDELLWDDVTCMWHAIRTAHVKASWALGAALLALSALGAYALHHNGHAH